MRNSKNISKFTSKINKKLRKRLLSRILKFNLDQKSLNKLLYKNDKSFIEDNILIQCAEKNIL